MTKDELIKGFGGTDMIKYDQKMRKTIEFLKENNQNDMDLVSLMYKKRGFYMSKLSYEDKINIYHMKNKRISRESNC